MPTNALLAQLLEPLQVAGLTVGLDGRVVYLNDAARGLLGVAAADGPAQGQPLRELLSDPAGGGVDEVLGQVLDGKAWRGEMSVRVTGSGRARLALQITPVRPGGAADGEVVGAVALLEPLEAVSLAETRLGDRLNRLARVTGRLTRAEDLRAVSTVMVEDVADAVGATVASVSLLEGEDTLVLVQVRGGRPGVETRWNRFPLAGTPVGDAILADRVVVLRDDDLRERYGSVERAAEGERSMVGLPLKVAGQVIGGMSLSFPGYREFDGAELEFLGSLGEIAAQAVQRVRTAAEVADQASKLRFLADATVELGASLDPQATLRTVAQMAVPWFADWCAISLAEDGVLRSVAVAHVDPGKVSLAEEYLERYPTDPNSSNGSYSVLRSGRSEIMEITEEMLVAAVTDPDQLDMLRALDFRSALMVPLKVKDRVLGVATWVSGENGRRFDGRDRLVGEDLGRRAAVAIDNARLHSEVREVAERLQRAVLPARLTHVPGWDAAVCYRSAGRSEVGGDFYDYIALSLGRVAMLVGDVMGRGVPAAAAMAHIRAACRTLIALDPDPAHVLAGLDRLFEHYRMSQLVTLAYAVADPAAGQLEIANAGHLPPLIRRADGRVEPVTGPVGILLGAGGGPRTTLTASFDEGDMLVMFTDGLVERRDEDIDEGISRLGRELATLDASTLAPALESVVDLVTQGGEDDDVAMLAVRLQHRPGADRGAAGSAQKPIGSPA